MGTEQGVWEGKHPYFPIDSRSPNGGRNLTKSLTYEMHELLCLLCLQHECFRVPTFKPHQLVPSQVTWGPPFHTTPAPVQQVHEDK